MEDAGSHADLRLLLITAGRDGTVGAEERSLTCPQARGWPVTVPGAGAAGPGSAWLSLFPTVDHDALFKGGKTELSIRP